MYRRGCAASVIKVISRLMLFVPQKILTINFRQFFTHFLKSLLVSINPGRKFSQHGCIAINSQLPVQWQKVALFFLQLIQNDLPTHHIEDETSARAYLSQHQSKQYRCLYTYCTTRMLALN